MTAKKRKDIVQVKNPRTGRYVKIDREEGRIVAHKKTKGAYKGIPVARRTSNLTTRTAPDEVTEAMNRVLESLGVPEPDAFVARASRRALERTEW